jgi:raffinose/stachyose/melibiose transport system permease protein
MKPKAALTLTGAILAAILYVFPFFIVLVSPFKSKFEILANPLGLPLRFDFSNFLIALEQMNFVSAFMNSVIVTVSVVVILIVFPSMFAYYLVRFDSKANRLVFFVMVASMIIPFQALMIPFVSIYGALNMLNNKLILIYFYLGFGISLSTFMYHGFIKTLPKALEESALIDGANSFQVFWYVVFPMLQPITATITILNALWIWNDFLLPSLALFQNDRTLPLSTFSFFGQYTSNYGLAMAGLALTIAPMIVFYVVMQRKIISGITEGSLK